ncbi:indole-3-acetaldehyde oxidase-like [Typha latifolia]|uniref:indole-3-acetaldehyde oxidase-like n=1 Tax=Typha latifolia TaxID=4733 RepID=UPI003C2D308C
MRGRPEPPNGFSKLTVSEAVKAISGNLCRCTGYRPIVDTCKSFADDVDLEDLGLNSFWKKGDKNVNVSRLPHYSSGGICTFPEFLKSEIKSISDVPGDAGLTASGGGYWYRPDSVEDLYKLLNSEAFSESSVKIVVGNTSTGVYKDQDLYDKYVDLRGIPELSVVKSDLRGEAVYVDDIPSPKNCLYGAFIYSTRPLAHVRGIKFSSSLASQKIVTVVSVNDIPKGGENVGSNFVFGSESLFAGSLTEYAGQPLGVVIAETQKHANMAAKLAIVEYDTGNLGRQSFLWKMLSEDPVILMFLLIFLLNK